MAIYEQKQQFILHWGEMGGRWGINRVSAQIHALLIASDVPLDAEAICELLSVSRSNISTGIRELKTWGLIRSVPSIGNRKEFFEAEKDAWEILARISERRIDYEIIPTLNFLKSLNQSSSAESFPKFINELSAAIELCLAFYKKLRSLPAPFVKRLLKLERSVQLLITKGKLYSGKK